MKIGIDIMGGDFAPEATVLGAIQACQILQDKATIVLIGDENGIHPILKREGFDVSRFEIVHTTEVINMSEHPAKTFSAKPDSSIVVGYNLLKTGAIDAFTSAGNTGAMLVGAMYVVKSIAGVIRPCITATVPQLSGEKSLILDVGINPDCKPDVLVQYAILGSIYIENVFGIKNPRVGLLNNGEEPEKGNLLTKATHEMLLHESKINFIGNVEGKDLYNGTADVIVCDGFTGNVILKQAESFYTIAKARNISDEYIDLFNFENYGGTPVLGINGNVSIGHGISNAHAIKNMILQAKEVVDVRLSDKIKEAFK
ncbi:MAG: phosphate acyltransferase PlsX [Marinilabiliales bacterium]|nr:MAG: phosphate acyltransferase PlsX [Marinilabiliales bacterium]